MGLISRVSSRTYRIVSRNPKMVGVKDVNQSDYVVALAAFFKKQGRMTVPKWTDFGKTNTGKQMSPFNDDWFYVRTAAIAVGRFTKIYGMGINNGMRPGQYRRGNGHIARFALQELEKMKFVTKAEKGRKLTKEGQQALDRIASAVAKQ